MLFIFLLNPADLKSREIILETNRGAVQSFREFQWRSTLFLNKIVSFICDLCKAFIFHDCVADVLKSWYLETTTTDCLVGVSPNTAEIAL